MAVKNLMLSVALVLFKVGTERSEEAFDVGGDSTKYSRRNSVDDQQQRLSRLRYEHCSAIRRQRELGHQRHDQYVLTSCDRYHRCAASCEQDG